MHEKGKKEEEKPAVESVFLASLETRVWWSLRLGFSAKGGLESFMCIHCTYGYMLVHAVLLIGFLAFMR